MSKQRRAGGCETFTFDRTRLPDKNIYIFKILLDIMKYRVLIEEDEDGIYIASAPELPGCISQGNTRDEAIKNIKDAVLGYLQSLKKHNEPIPSCQK